MRVGVKLVALSATLAQVLALSKPPQGALVVGQGGQYSKIGDAVRALSSSSSSEQVIYIESGTYAEQVYIPALKGPLTIYGATPGDSSTFSDNTVTITHGASQKTVSSNDLTATLRVHTSAGFKLYNVNVVNSFGKGSQALALSAWGANQGYYNDRFVGYQDTLLAETGEQVYAKCYIEGAIDFIFGQRGKGWFDGCDIRVSDSVGGSITASGRSSNDDTQYVIHKSSIAAKDGVSVAQGNAFLGRPWRNYAKVTFQFTGMSPIINAAGFTTWQPKDPRIDQVSFGEYQNTGPGSQGARASFDKKLDAAVKIEDVLGGGYASAFYVDKAYLSSGI